MYKVGPVPGSLINKFYDDDAYWGTRGTVDDLFEVHGKTTGYYAFKSDEPVYVIGGAVDGHEEGRMDLKDFFQNWLRTIPPTFVVTTTPDREAELAALLAQHGFSFQTPDKLAA